MPSTSSLKIHFFTSFSSNWNALATQPVDRFVSMRSHFVGNMGRQEESVRLLWNANDNLMAEEEESEHEYKCGWLWFKPDWLQRLKTSAWALAFISSAAFLQGAIVNGLLHLMIPTIERRFNLRSFKSGLVSGGYDIASLICLIPVTYIGGRPNSCKPTWIGIGVIVMGIGALIFASPYFITTTPFNMRESVISTLCNATADPDEDCQYETPLSTFMWVFLIGNLFHGGGASPLYTLGITYIDESVVKKKTGIYMGVTICC